MNRDQIGLQLYTVRELAKADFAGTLAKVAEVGYQAVEFAGLHGMPATDVRRVLDTNGLRAMGAHVPIDAFENRFDAVLDELQTLGCGYAIVPFLAPDRRNVEQIGELAKRFNDWGARCQEAGLRFGYHNHQFEFTEKAPDGQSFFDLLLAATAPAFVSFELDVMWARNGGYDPVDLIGRNADRIDLLHIKDAARDDPAVDVPFGEGTLPWATILEAAREAGVAWYIVEQDKPNDPLADIGSSLRNAEGMATA